MSHELGLVCTGLLSCELLPEGLEIDRWVKTALKHVSVVLGEVLEAGLIGPIHCAQDFFESHGPHDEKEPVADQEFALVFKNEIVG